MTNQEIKTVGQTIAAETQIGGNTAERVGGVIEGIGDALDNKDAAVGYYLATMSGSTIYINASSYRLGTGGNLRAKMPAAATTACTLTVGNAQAVQLWYNGAAVSADNSWEAGEIVTIFYDGTRFMASNSQGGGGQFGSGEKIKDILLSQVLGAGTGVITSQKGVSDAIFNEIDISSIDSLKTLNDALAPSSSLKPTYYTVTAMLSSVKLKVGSMAVISDNMRHVVTEIMATHYLLDDAGNLTNEHSDAEIFFIYRSVKLSGGTLPDPAGTWTKWRYVNSSVWSTVAEKIKYDNSQSGLAAENVQGAMDELAEDSDVYAECLADCIQGAGVKDYVSILSTDLGRLNASFGSATNRINLKKDSLISTEGYIKAQLRIPISAISGGVDRATIGLYNSSKANLSSLDLGWFYFSGNDLLITLDLSNPTYSQVAYISCYFGCASGSIALSNIDAPKITFIMTASSGQIEKAVTENGMQQYLNDYEVLSNCGHIGGNTVVKQISNYDLLNGNAAFAAASKRLVLGKDSLMDVRGGSSITLFVPYSAVSSARLITQCTIGLYDNDKNWLQSLDLGWKAFNGSDKTITVDLSEPTYKEVAYVSCYFYSASNIDQNSIDASGITFTLTYPDEYHTKAVDTRMFETLTENADVRTMVSYYGQKMGCVHKFDSKEIMYMPSYSEARQGADIYGNYLFQCFNKNPYIQIWDLSTRTLTQTIQFTPDSNNHCGSVSFGDFYDSTDPFPLLYISAFNVNYVYVYRISGEIGNLSMTLIQTITIDSTWMRMPYFAYDRINKKMLVYGYTKNSFQDPNNNPMKFGYMNIPDPTNASITLTSSDMIKTYEMPYVFAGQSSAARYGNLYLMWGYAGNAQGSGIKMYDYINGIILAECDTNELLNHTDEWQGAGWWNDSLVTTSKDGIVRLLEF